MTLNEMIAQKGGVGFKMKSMKTGKVWEVLAKTVTGKIVIANEEKEDFVSGDADRYELVVENQGRIDEIQAKLDELETKRDELAEQIADIDDEAEGLQEELENLVV